MSTTSNYAPQYFARRAAEAMKDGPLTVEGLALLLRAVHCEAIETAVRELQPVYRNAALDEAEKLARDWGWSSTPDHAHGIADAILALKGNGNG